MNARRSQIGMCAALMAATGLISGGPGGSPSARAAFDPDEDRALRITSETGFGILGGAAGAFTGAIAGGLLCSALSDDAKQSFGCLGGALIGGLTGEFLGIWLGSFAGGEIAGGNGGLGWTLVGTSSGAVVAGLLLGMAEIDVGALGWWLIATALPLAGSIVGYELSTTREGPRTVGGSFTFLF